MDARARTAIVIAAASLAVAGVVLVAVLNAKPRAQPRPAPSAAAPHPLPATLPREAVIEVLAAQTREDPEDARAWIGLAQAQAAAGHFGDAANAYAQAARRTQATASFLADRADVLAMAQGRRFEGEPDRFIAEALALEPRHTKALALAGSSAFNRGAYSTAAAHWRRLLEVAPAGSEMARQVERNLAEAERRAAPAPVEGGKTERR
jgi:cytochrome c-type biogenesis protein CcmH